MVAGIIAEYNPFHNGHLHQINKLREKLGESCTIIACISGGLTQRGELPVLSKWQRGALAVENGVNLVLELPAVFTSRSAQHFAFGGISLFHKLGVVNHLIFSCAHPDLPLLNKIAGFDLANYKNELQTKLKEGFSYASAAAELMAQNIGTEAAILHDPNTILAIEYLKAIKQLNSTIQPLAMQRTGSHHNDHKANGQFASGRAIRNMLQKNCLDELKLVLPSTTCAMLTKEPSITFDMHQLYPALQLMLMTSSPEQLRKIDSMSEGLEYKLIEAANASSMTEFINTLVSKRYQRTRISRLILHLLLNLTNDITTEADQIGSPYARVLAFDNKGRELIKKLKKVSTIPLITKVSEHINRRDLINKHLAGPLEHILYYDIIAQNIYELCQKSPVPNHDFLASPIYIQK